MIRKGFGFAVAGLTLAISPNALADDRAPVTLEATGGTLGIGPEISYRITDRVGVRANITFLGISHGFDSGDVHYDGKALLGSGGVMIDYHPFANGFYVSGGARLDRNKVRAVASPTSNVTINGTVYTPSQIGTLRGYADFRPIAPTATVGYAGSLGGGFVLGIEGGAMFMGSARVQSLTYSGSGIVAPDVQAERMKLQNDVSKYRVFPILQITAGYRFGIGKR